MSQENVEIVLQLNTLFNVGEAHTAMDLIHPDVHAGVIFIVNAQRGRLPGSTGWVQTRIADIVTWAGGLIERQTAYTDIDEARTDAEQLAQERG